MKISGTKKAFVIMMVALLLHSSSVSIGQKLPEKGGTGATTDPSSASPTENNEGEENLPAPASILNQRLPSSKPLKGQTDKIPSELQQQRAQGLSYQDHQPAVAVGSGLPEPLSGPHQPFSPGVQNSLVQHIPFANGALKQKTSSIQQAAMLVSAAAAADTVFLLSLL